MSQRILAVAPHPDDETLGCGGTLLRMSEQGEELAWLIVTGISEDQGFPVQRVRERDAEIARVVKTIGFRKVFNLGLPAARLDRIPMADLIEKFSEVFKAFAPHQVFLPYRSDVHTDHREVFDAGSACVKWFRYPSIQRVLAYETLSETELTLDPREVFQPNYFVNVSQFLERKIELMSIYRSELG